MPDVRHLTTGVTRGVEWVYASAAHARGIMFVPPLIGGHALQHVRELRQLYRRRFSIVSFNYAGHGYSHGDFSLKASLINTQRILGLAEDYGNDHQLPLFGMASCFAAIPLLKAASVHTGALARIVLINAVPKWHLAKTVGNFIDYWRKSDLWRPTWQGLILAMRAYRDDLLPGLVHRRKAFGLLTRDRVRWSRVWYEILSQRIVPDAAVKSTPVLCVYGQRDHLLHQIGFSGWSQYEAHIKSICGQVQFKPLNSNHFLTHPPIRGQLFKEIERFLV
jgi:hypothetical protein